MAIEDIAYIVNGGKDLYLRPFRHADWGQLAASDTVSHNLLVLRLVRLWITVLLHRPSPRPVASSTTWQPTPVFRRKLKERSTASLAETVSLTFPTGRPCRISKQSTARSCDADNPWVWALRIALRKMIITRDILFRKVSVPISDAFSQLPTSTCLPQFHNNRNACARKYMASLLSHFFPGYWLKPQGLWHTTKVYTPNPLPSSLKDSLTKTETSTTTTRS